MIDPTEVHEAIAAAGINVLCVDSIGNIVFGQGVTQEQRTQAVAIATTPAMLVSLERREFINRCNHWWNAVSEKGYSTGLGFRLRYDLLDSLGLSAQYSMLKTTGIQPNDPVLLWDANQVPRTITFSQFETVAYGFLAERTRLSTAMATAVGAIHATNDITEMEAATVTLEGVV